METPVFTGISVRFVTRMDNRAPVHRVDTDQDTKKIGALRDLENARLTRRAFAFNAHFTRAGKYLASDEKWNHFVDQPVPGDSPAHEIVVMATVTVSDKIGIVFVESDFA